MQIYKIFTAPQWAEMQSNGKTLGAPIDLADGFVHFSTAKQAATTAALHFKDQSDLWLIAANGAEMSALKWEKSRGGDDFPHLFAPFEMADVLWAVELPLGPNGHQFPTDMP